MRWNGAIYLAVLAISTVGAVFVDDAYNIDYHEALLGQPQPHATFFHKPHASSNASLLYALSDKSVFGAINPRDGKIVWRQALSGLPVKNTEYAFLIAGQGDSKVTTGFNHTVAAWDASNGRLIWDHILRDASEVIGLETVPGPGSQFEATQDVVVLSKSHGKGGFTISRLAGDDAKEIWTHRDSSTSLDSLVSIATSTKHVFYVSKSSGLLSGGKAKVAMLDIGTGKEVKDYSVAADSDGLGPAQKFTVGSGSTNPILVSTEKPYKSIKVNILGESKVSTLTLEEKGEEITKLSFHYAPVPDAEPHVLVHATTPSRQWAEVFHVNSKSGEAKKAYTLPATQEKSAFAATTAGSKAYFTRITDSEVQVYSSESHGSLGRWVRKRQGAFDYVSQAPLEAVAEVVSRKGAEVAVRTAITSPDGNLFMVRNGEMQWYRPEMLAYATIAAWSDDVAPNALVEELRTEILSNPVSAYFHRLTRHAQELTSLPQYLFDLPKNLFTPSSDSISTRQKLIGPQSVIVATSKLQLIALDAANKGEVQWQTDLRSVASADTTVKYLSSEDDGRVIIYLSDGSLIVANATNGQYIEHMTGTIPVSRMIEMKGHPASSMVKVDEDGVPKLPTDFAPSVPTEGNSILTVNKKGEAMGWTVGLKVEKLWTLEPRNGAKVINAVGRPVHDPVASIGRVLGDRSVLYKYISPNLALLTATYSTTLTMYLIDAVTGAVLHSAVHEGVLTDTPIPSVLSENWFAYSFTSYTADPSTNTETLSTQLIISELYESSIPNDRNALAKKSGNYSSFSADSLTPPHVISQSFTIAEPMSHLIVTQTSQGIASRDLIAYLPNSHTIAAIPRHLLDARRPVGRDPNSFEQEEGLFRYDPILNLDPKQYLSHAQDVIGISKLMSAPTLLESTSLVFAFGHDVFGTQVAPSMTFDVLGKTFNRVQLILTVVGLYIGVLAIRPVARKKIVDRMWL